MNIKKPPLLLALIILLLLPAQALALTEVVSLFQVGNSEYLAAGQKRVMDVAPIVIDGRTYVPLRYLAYSIGITDENIRWDPAASKVTLAKDGKTVELFIGKPEMTVNGSPQAIEAAPIIADGRVFLPARYIAIAFGYSITWNAEQGLVSINTEASPMATKDYIDKENNFRLRYPAGWSARKASSSGTVAFFAAPPENSNDDYSENITVLHLKNQVLNSLSSDELQEYILSNQSNSLPVFNIYETGAVDLSGLPAQYVKARCSDGEREFCVHQVIVKEGDECFMLTLSVKEDKLSQYGDLYNRVLKSFRMLDQVTRVFPAGTAKYDGQWSEPDDRGYIYPHGWGKMTYTNGDIYEGDFEYGKREGLGSYWARLDDDYHGQWKDDKRHGRGILFGASTGYKEKMAYYENDVLIKVTDFQKGTEPMPMAPTPFEIGP
ncbi:MAG: hypothetical protein HPY50_12290 [Firmicutes bacterium]|nr:hypothetical protein [Bacillota bacterium]